MQNKNSRLLRVFINEVQEVGIFNHPAMIEIVKQHKLKKLSNSSHNSENDQKNQEDNDNVIDYEKGKKKEDDLNSTEGKESIDHNHSSSKIVERKEHIENTNNSSIVKETKESVNNISNSSQENLPNKNKPPLPLPPTENKTNTVQLKTNPQKILFQKYVEYVRRTGDCEYPPLAEYLFNQKRVKK